MVLEGKLKNLRDAGLDILCVRDLWGGRYVFLIKEILVSTGMSRLSREFKEDIHFSLEELSSFIPFVYLKTFSVNFLKN